MSDLPFLGEGDRNTDLTLLDQQTTPFSRYEGWNGNLTPPHTGGGQEARFVEAFNLGKLTRLVPYGTRGTDAGIEIQKTGYYEVDASMLEYGNFTGRCDAELRVNNFTMQPSLDFFYAVGEYRVHDFHRPMALKAKDVITLVSINANIFEGNTWTWVVVKWMGI